MKFDSQARGHLSAISTFGMHSEGGGQPVRQIGAKRTIVLDSNQFFEENNLFPLIKL